MTINLRRAALLLMLSLALPLLGACSPSSSPAPQPASQTDEPDATTSSQPDTVIGKAMEKGMREAREELARSNISIGGDNGIDVNVNGRHVAGHGNDNLPKAEITPQGDLLIENKPVTITPRQRAMLLGYRQQIIGIAEAGMAMGTKGVDLAGKAMKEALGGVFGGNSDEAQKRIEAEGRKLEAEAKLICGRLPAMLDAQQQLAASLPEFKPYATMTQDDVDDCMDDDGASVTSH